MFIKDISDGIIITISEKYEEIRIQTNETATYQINKVVTLLIRQKAFVQKDPTAKGTRKHQSLKIYKQEKNQLAVKRVS
jgi:uncharacterized membrane protein